MLTTVYYSLFVLMLSSAMWQPSGANPTGARLHVQQVETACKDLAIFLLRNVTETLAIDSLFRGLNCTDQSAELYLKTRTLSVCVPQQQSKCSDSTDFTFDQDKCLLRIMEDLKYYQATFKAYSDPGHILDQKVIKSIGYLMQNCFYDSSLVGSEDTSSMEQENSFEERLKLCKTLKGFHVRAVTINRVLNHILATAAKAKMF